MATVEVTTGDDLEVAMGVIGTLSSEIGGRRPTGPAEREAAERLARLLDSRGIDAGLEGFRGYATFAAPFSIILALALAPALVPRSRRVARMLPAAGAVLGLVSEGSLLRAPISQALSRRRSQNVVAAIEPSGTGERTLCLVAHMDTSRSGLLFHPRLVPLMSRWIAGTSLLVLAAAGIEPFAARSRLARRSLVAIRAGLLAGLGLLAEREVRGVDVPGANDNASGCGVVMALAARLAADPLRSTRVVVLITGC